MYSRVMALRKVNPDLKVLLAVGGWKHRGEPFTDIVKDPVKQTKFVQQTYEFIKKRGFDGFDLDWEYPGIPDRGSEPEDKRRFTGLVEEFRRKFGDEFLLTAAVGAGKDVIEEGTFQIQTDRHLKDVVI